MAYTFYGTNYSETIDGTNFADIIYGYGGNDLLRGWAGNDHIYGGSGNDDIFGGTGINTLWGGGGEDWFIMSARANAASDDLIADFEFDVDQVDVSAWGISDFSQIKALLTTDGFGDATFNAFAGGYAHRITFDTISPNQLAANDFIYSGGGARNIVGTAYADTIFGSLYADTLNGSYGDDIVLGGIGADRLLGSYGNDDLHGGAGRDVMTGGAGYDFFTFDAITDSVPGVYRDVITDFQEDIDTIDVHKIDANVFAGGNQAFQFIGNHAFTAAGQLAYYFSGANTVVTANTDADATPEFQVALVGNHYLIGSDFIL
jgi:Ca2+-binding RTX toxin-like protein